MKKLKFLRFSNFWFCPRPEIKEFGNRGKFFFYYNSWQYKKQKMILDKKNIPLQHGLIKKMKVADVSKFSISKV